MSEQKHTPEPWRICEHKPPFYAGDCVIIGNHDDDCCGEFILAQCNHNYPELSKSNARRIVACVNACAGIPSEVLEIPCTDPRALQIDRLRIMQGRMVARDELVDGLEKQRDKLLSEMERYLPVLEVLESFPSEWALMTAGTGIATINGYRNAIAKARGQV